MCTTGPTSTPAGPPTAYACTFDRAITGYVAKACYGFVADISTGGAATINLHSLGAKAITKVQGGITTPLVANDIRAGQIVRVCYDGTQMQCQNCDGNAPASGSLTRSIVIPAGGMDVEGACALAPATVLVTNGPKVTTMTCTDTDTDGMAWDVLMPDSWDGGTITVMLAGFYTGTTHNTQIVDVNFSGQCVRSGDTVAAWAITSGATAESTTNREVQLTASGTANREIMGTSLALTLAGTCAGGAHIYLHGLIDAASTTFTPMSEWSFLGVKIEYVSTGTD